MGMVMGRTEDMTWLEYPAYKRLTKRISTSIAPCGIFGVTDPCEQCEQEECDLRESFVFEEDDSDFQFELEEARRKANEGQFEEALSDFDHILKRRRNVMEAKFGRAYCLLNLGHYKNALEILNKLRGTEYKRGRTFNTLGLIRIILGDEQGSLQDFEEAIRADQNSGCFWSNRGVAYFTSGDKERALEAFQKACEAVPDNPIYHYHRGILLCSIGRLDDARQSFQQSLRLAPGWAMAEEALAAVE